MQKPDNALEGMEEDCKKANKLKDVGHKRKMRLSILYTA